MKKIYQRRAGVDHLESVPEAVARLDATTAERRADDEDAMVMANRIIREKDMVSRSAVLKVLNDEIRRHMAIERGDVEEDSVTYSATDALKVLKDQIRVIK